MGDFKSFARAKESPSFTDTAYREIRRLIMEGEIEPGGLISENQIAEYLNMSRTPVREATRRLQAEGLLESKKGLGTFLKPLSTSDISNIYSVREALELLACDTAIHNITEEDLESAEAILTDMLRTAESGGDIDYGEFIRVDRDLHDRIVARSNNEYLIRMTEMINVNVNRYRILSVEVSSDAAESTRQHLEIIRLIREKDLPALKEYLGRHIRWSLQLILDYLNN